MRPFLAAAWGLGALGLLGAGPALAQSEAPLDDVELVADEVVADEIAQTVTASGAVKLTYRDVVITADRLRYDTANRRGEVAGSVLVTSETYRLTATRGRFDLLAEEAELAGFRGHWFGRAQVAGETLRLGRTLIEVENGWITPCQHPEPDLKLAARRLRYMPESERLNFAAEGVSVQVWDRDLLSFPFYTTTVGEDDEPWEGNLLPGFGFDAYHGFLTTAQLDFSLGDNSRGTIPVTFSTGRGLGAGIQHVVDGLGPGQLSNAVFYETPWAANRGGLRAYNSYRWFWREAGRLELAGDYRADVNNLPVTRLPELAWYPLTQNFGGWLIMQNELRAGYLLEEPSEVKSLRARWTAPVSTPMFHPLPQYQTWLSGQPFVNAYDSGFYGGGTLAWHHRQVPIPGLAFSQMGEVARVFGATPFIHDRVYDVERVRVGVDKEWGRQVTTGVMASWSRLNQQGPFALEDLAFTGAYRWNCFGTTLALRPLILGVDLQFQLFNF